MTSQQKGLWVFISLLLLLLAYQGYQYFSNTISISPLPQPSSSQHLTVSKDSSFHCQTTPINTADSLTILHQLGLTPKVTSSLLRYKKIIRYFLSKEDVRKVYGIEKFYPKIENCLDFSLPSLPKINLNQADSTDLALFLPASLAARIYKYRRKKGRFANWKDLEPIYGLHERHQTLLQHFCYLGEGNPRNASQKQFPKFDLNQADSARLEKLPRIGPKMASRIIKYRNLLPFFIDHAQLQEVYGMNDTILNILKENTFIAKPPYTPKSLNQLEFYELSKHPYIGKQNAKLIIQYRKMHGNLTDWQDLHQIKELQLKNEAFLKQYFTLP